MLFHKAAPRMSRNRKAVDDPHPRTKTFIYRRERKEEGTRTHDGHRRHTTALRVGRPQVPSPPATDHALVALPVPFFSTNKHRRHGVSSSRA